MANLNLINIGNLVNDGTGDDLRTAFEKVNANFVELQGSITVTASNLAGVTDGAIFKEKVGNDLKFKNLLAGSKISLESFSDSIRINCTQPDAFTRIATDLGVISANSFQQITIQGGTNITVSAVDAVMTIDTVQDLSHVLIDYDFGPLTTNYSNVIQLSLSASNIDFGTVGNPGDFYMEFGPL
jgi:hypothetical protein